MTRLAGASGPVLVPCLVHHRAQNSDDVLTEKNRPEPGAPRCTAPTKSTWSLSLHICAAQRTPGGAGQPALFAWTRARGLGGGCELWKPLGTTRQQDGLSLYHIMPLDHDSPLGNHDARSCSERFIMIHCRYIADALTARRA